MERQRFFCRRNFIKNRQRIGRRLLGCLGSGIAFNSAPHLHADGEHQTGKDRAAYQKEKNLPAIKPADRFIVIDVDGSAAEATA